MALIANLPFVLSAGMGLNAYFIYTVVGTLGYTWQVVLFAVFNATLFSISEGISFGIISYVLLNLVCGKAKKISPVMYVLAVLFILKYIFL